MNSILIRAKKAKNDEFYTQYSDIEYVFKKVDGNEKLLIHKSFPIGTIREWKGKKYKKLPNGDWKPVSEKRSLTEKVLTEKKLYSSLSEKEKKLIRQKLTGKPIATAKYGLIVAKEGEKIVSVAQKWAEDNFKTPAKTVIGDVVVNKSGVHNSLAHGFGKDKIATIPVIKDVLEKGEYLGYEMDFDGKPIENHYFAGKVRLGDNEKIMFCRIRRRLDSDNRFYVHEVFTEEDIKREGYLQTAAIPLERGKHCGGVPLYMDILHGILGNVNKKLGNIAENKKEDKKSIKKSFCFFDKEGHLWFRKSAFRKSIKLREMREPSLWDCPF